MQAFRPRRPTSLSAALLAACAAVALLAGLCACGRREPAADEQLRELRQRMDRMEQEGAEERARLAEELAAMRQDVNALRESQDEANRQLALLSGQDPVTLGPHPASTPRANLRRRLHEMYDASREAIDRLGRGLDRSLHRVQSHNGTDSPAK